MGAMLDGGLPLGLVLRHAAPASGDPALAERVTMARTDVLAGACLSHALSQRKVFTDTAIRLVRAGEESGRLAQMLAHAARIEQAAAEQHTTRALRLVEPMLILAFGTLVAFVAAALLQAVYAIRPGA